MLSKKHASRCAAAICGNQQQQGRKQGRGQGGKRPRRGQQQREPEGPPGVDPALVRFRTVVGPVFTRVSDRACLHHRAS